MQFAYNFDMSGKRPM